MVIHLVKEQSSMEKKQVIRSHKLELTIFTLENGDMLVDVESRRAQPVLVREPGSDEEYLARDSVGLTLEFVED